MYRCIYVHISIYIDLYFIRISFTYIYFSLKFSISYLSRDDVNRPEREFVNDTNDSIRSHRRSLDSKWVIGTAYPCSDTILTVTPRSPVVTACRVYLPRHVYARQWIFLYALPISSLHRLFVSA